MPRVGVVIPTFNCAPFVASAVDSVLAQTLQDFELIVVDDGSTDNTREVLSPYFSDARFRYIRQDNRGVPSARNAAAMATNSEYLAFLDADDALPPDALEIMADRLDHSGANWSLIDIVKVIGQRREVRRTILPEGDILLGILRDDFIYRAMFFRRASFLRIGMYDENMRYREDWDINIRMIEQREPFVCIDRPLYLYSWREGSITTGNRAKVLDYTGCVLRKHHKRIADAGDRRVAEIYAQNMWDLGRRYFYIGDHYQKALSCLRESLAYDLNPGRMFHPLVHQWRRLRGSA